MSKMVGPKKIFLAKNQDTQTKKKIKIRQNYTFRVNFQCQKSTEFFQKKKKNHL